MHVREFHNLVADVYKFSYKEEWDGGGNDLIVLKKQIIPHILGDVNSYLDCPVLNIKLYIKCRCLKADMSIDTQVRFFLPEIISLYILWQA